MRTLLILAAIAAITLAAGCKKPYPPIPEPPQDHGWVVSSWTIISSEHFPVTVPRTYTQKQQTLFRYNSAFRPITKLTRSTLKGDTLQVYDQYLDSFFYDNRHRVVELRGYETWDNSIAYLRKYLYNGVDTLPFRSEIHQVRFPPLGLYVTIDFFYGPEDVEAIARNSMQEVVDSAWYDYDAEGNFKNYIQEFGTTSYYQGYTDVVNPLLFHNISNGLVIAAPLSLESPVKISPNQWRESMEIQNYVVDSITMNAQGLPGIVHVAEHFSNGRRYHDIRYEYIPTK